MLLKSIKDFLQDCFLQYIYICINITYKSQMYIFSERKRNRLFLKISLKVKKYKVLCLFPV